MRPHAASSCCKVPWMLLVALALAMTPCFVFAQISYTFKDDGDDGYDQARADLRVQPHISDDEGGSYPLPYEYLWLSGTTHTVWVEEVLYDPEDPGVRYSFDRWEDGSTNPMRVFTVTGTGPYVFTAYYRTEFYLEMDCEIHINQTGGEPVACGTLTPGTGWYPSGDVVEIYTRGPGVYFGGLWEFDGWQGTGPGSSNSSEPSTSITMYGPITQMAHWSYPFHVYDQPYSEFHSRRDRACFNWPCSPPGADADVSESGAMWVRADGMSSGGVYAYTFASVGSLLDESDGDFELKAMVEIKGDPPFGERLGQVTRSVGIRLVNKTKKKTKTLEVQKVTNQPTYYSRHFNPTMKLGDDEYSLEVYAHFELSYGSLCETCKSNRWDFWEGDNHISVRELNIRPTTESGAQVTFGFVPELTHPGAVVCEPGGSVELPVEVSSFGAFAAPVALHLDTLPAGFSYSFTPETVIPPPGGVGLSLLVVNAPADAEGSGLPLRAFGTIGSDTTNATEVVLSFQPGLVIPTLSDWGILVLTLLLLTAGIVAYRRQREA